jgi:hypothetical protein
MRNCSLFLPPIVVLFAGLGLIFDSTRISYEIKRVLIVVCSNVIYQQ